MEPATPGNQPAVTPLAAAAFALVVAGLVFFWVKSPGPGVGEQLPQPTSAIDEKPSSPDSNPQATRQPRSRRTRSGADPETIGSQQPDDDRGVEPGDPPDSELEADSDGSPDAEGWHTRTAAQAIDQRSIAPDDPEYDPVTEARQLFFPLEEALQAARPLSPLSYKEVLGNHKDTSAEVFTRAGDLLRQGQTEAAKQLLAEWNRLYLVYKDETYPAQARARTSGGERRRPTQDEEADE